MLKVARWFLARKKVRDIYGNWVWEEEEDNEKIDPRRETPNPAAEENYGEDLHPRKGDNESSNKDDQGSGLH